MRAFAVPRFVGRPLEDNFTVLFIFFALLYGVVQLFILTSLSRTIRWPVILFGFAAGMSASASAAILIERGSALLFAAALHPSLSSITVFDSYTFDPIVEEFCKVLPLLLVLLIPRVRTRLGFSDLVVICAVLGSGFAFTESTLRFGSGASAAHWSGGYWLISQGFSSAVIPGPGVILRSWLPLGVTAVRLFARANIGLNTHLIWSAIVGLGIGLVLRAARKWKWMALLCFIFACLDHATSNAAQLRVRFPFMLSPAFAAMRHFIGFYALIPLVVATCLDRSVFRRGLADEPGLSLPAERQGKFGMITLALGYLSKPELLRDLWLYVLQRRAFACGKAINPSDESLPSDRARQVAMVGMLRRNQSVSWPVFVARLSKAPSRAVYQRILPRKLQRFLLVLFALPPSLNFLLGDFPSIARLQSEFAKSIVFHTLTGSLIACMIWQVLVLIGQALDFTYLRENEGSQALVWRGLSLVAGVGALVFSATTLIVLPNHRPLQQISQYPNARLNFALSTGVILIGLAFLDLWVAVELGLVAGSISEAVLSRIITKADESLQGPAAQQGQAETESAYPQSLPFWQKWFSMLPSFGSANFDQTYVNAADPQSHPSNAGH